MIDRENNSNMRCVKLTKELIKHIEQHFVDESHIIAVYKNQKLFLTKKKHQTLFR